MNIFDIYYNNGCKLPFEVRRYPRGYRSVYYDSQSVLVTKVIPKGKYGDAYGFYLKNGERADGYWCSKDVIEPQLIPNCGCGGWILTNEVEDYFSWPLKTYGKLEYDSEIDELLKANNRMKFGKYKGKTLAKVKEIDEPYLRWAEEKVAGFYVDWDSFQ